MINNKIINSNLEVKRKKDDLLIHWIIIGNGSCSTRIWTVVKECRKKFLICKIQRPKLHCSHTQNVAAYKIS